MIPVRDLAEEGNGNLQNDGDTNNPFNSSATEGNIAEVTEKKLKKQTFRVALKVVEKTTGPGMSLSEEFLADAKRKLAELNNRDACRAEEDSRVEE
ncbi:hypothetical protein BVRB_010500 [Beta vulgaris subsp. vulgaris]|uniref:Uncharacterized protein n=1 Tax=Beta vulgaris subsp. vulgaris TaxID=3555 RepID=A0A0J8B2P1_BETVV|nr:hypothetical protein BVRB_010500 [Beta vulgaris subsp. vulgaris]